MALLDPGAGDNPVIGGLNHLCQVSIGEDLFRDGATGSQYHGVRCFLHRLTFVKVTAITCKVAYPHSALKEERPCKVILLTVRAAEKTLAESAVGSFLVKKIDDPSIHYTAKMAEYEKCGYAC
jgi:hypothetical protein